MISKAQLEKLYSDVEKERDIAYKKLQEVKRLHEECEDEYQARNSMLYSLKRMIELKSD